MIWLLSAVLSLVLLLGVLCVIYPELLGAILPFLAKRWKNNFHYFRH